MLLFYSFFSKSLQTPLAQRAFLSLPLPAPFLFPSLSLRLWFAFPFSWYLWLSTFQSESTNNLFRTITSPKFFFYWCKLACSFLHVKFLFKFWTRLMWSITRLFCSNAPRTLAWTDGVLNHQLLHGPGCFRAILACSVGWPISLPWKIVRSTTPCIPWRATRMIFLLMAAVIGLAKSCNMLLGLLHETLEVFRDAGPLPTSLAKSRLQAWRVEMVRRPVQAVTSNAHKVALIAASICSLVLRLRVSNSESCGCFIVCYGSVVSGSRRSICIFCGRFVLVFRKPCPQRCGEICCFDVGLFACPVPKISLQLAVLL